MSYFVKMLVEFIALPGTFFTLCNNLHSNVSTDSKNENKTQLDLK